MPQTSTLGGYTFPRPSPWHSGTLQLMQLARDRSSSIVRPKNKFGLMPLVCFGMVFSPIPSSFVFCLFLCLLTQCHVHLLVLLLNYNTITQLTHSESHGFVHQQKAMHWCTLTTFSKRKGSNRFGKKSTNIKDWGAVFLSLTDQKRKTEPLK